MQSVFLKTNVTCIRFLCNYMVAGIGGELRVYTESTQKTSNWIQVYNVLVFPPQYIYGIIPNDCKILVFGGRKLALLSYKLDPLEIELFKVCKFSDWILDAIWLDTEDEIALLTANNSVHKYNLNLEKTTSILKCEELCILYSGKLLNSTWEKLVVLAGTVFQEIVVWCYSADNFGNRVLHRLKGHKGVIFSVIYDPSSKLVCSTSDDRSIRIWNVKFSSCSNNEEENWRNCAITLKISIFSHLARVWKSQIVSENKFISVGEDSLISIWNEKGECVNKWNGHQGGAIWSVDFSVDLGLIATGGSDGGISVWPICDRTCPAVIHQSSAYIPESNPRSVTFSSAGDVVMITNQGHLMCYRGNEWSTYLEDHRFASYCILQMSPSRQILAMANIDGFVIILKVENNCIVKLYDDQLFQGRIFSLFWLSESLIITCGPSGKLITWTFSDFTDLIQFRQYSLPNSKERWITAAIQIDGHILCGDRSGSIHLYEVDSTELEPVHSIKKLHGYKGVSSIKCIDDTIISTGRDGTYRRLEINGKLIKVLDSNRVEMEWISTIESTPKFGMIIYGFHDVYLIVWSCLEGRPLLKLDCGGGHRSWDHLIEETTDFLNITYIKDKSVYAFTTPVRLIYHRTSELGYHSKSINSACTLDVKNIDCDYILTGGEDNTLRLVRWDGKRFDILATLNRHISSIRTVHSIEDSLSGSQFVVTAGGRGQLIVWQVMQYDTGKVKIVESASHMVRETYNYQRNSKQMEPLPDPETRYMDVKIVKTTDVDFLILAGCSDGLFRLLNYNTDTNKITLLKSCNFHEHCILRIAHFHWHDILFAITMTTAGNVAFWNVNTLLEQPNAVYLPTAYSLHSLGINSYGILIEKDMLLLATGSDDATMAITVFKLMGNNKHALLTSWIEKTLHTCQITGVNIIKNLIISVALDQKISLLKWKLNDGYLNVNLISQIATSIPDIHGLLAWIKPENTINVCVYGLGIELFKQIAS